MRIKWVQPRVLDVKQVSQPALLTTHAHPPHAVPRFAAQIASIRDRLKTWAGKVHETAIYLEASAPELIKPVST